MSPRQPVVLDIVHKFELPDGDAGLPEEKREPDPAAKRQRQQKPAGLQRTVAPERV